MPDNNAGNCLCCGDWYAQSNDDGLCATCAELAELCRPAYDMNAYQTACLRTWNGSGDQKGQLCNALLGLAGEAGELIDRLKKTIFHDHELDMDAVELEIGDVMYYLAIIAALLGVSLSYVAQQNVTKLRERYPDGFDVERSRERVR